MRHIILIYLLFGLKFVFGQNLLYNGSIEELTVPCISGFTQGNTPSNEVKNISAIKLTPDFYNECVKSKILTGIPFNYAGYQWARTGRGYAAFVNSIYGTNYNKCLGTEIISFSLKGTLIAGKIYFLRFFVSLADSVGYATDLMEAVLSSQDTLNSPDSLSYLSIVSGKGKGILNNSKKWLEIQGSIAATGKEKFIHIGRFHRISSANIQTSNTNAKPWTFPDYDRLYYYIDDVALWPADTVAPLADAGNDTLICAGDSVLLGGHNYADYYYSWWQDSICVQNGASELQRDKHQGRIWVKPLRSTWYYVQATDFKYDKSLDSVYIAVKQCKAAIADTGICMGASVRLGSGDPFFVQWQWHPPEYMDHPSVAQPLVYPPHSITYYVQATDSVGNIRTDSVHIEVKLCDMPPEIEIPNVFTPNGDGYNDYFRFKNEAYWELEVWIYNRWGNLVFAGDKRHHWNGNIKGSPAAEGVYFYRIKARVPDTGWIKEYSGSLHLLRN